MVDAQDCQAMRRRFGKARSAARQTWQIRDLRAKAASDVETLGDANALLAHGDPATTSIYRRKVRAVMLDP